MTKYFNFVIMEMVNLMVENRRIGLVVFQVMVYAFNY